MSILRNALTQWLYDQVSPHDKYPWQQRGALLMTGGGYKKTEVLLMLYHRQEVTVTMATDRRHALHPA